MPGPKGWYRPLGKGVYEVVPHNGRAMKVRMNPALLDKAGYLRSEPASSYMSGQDMLNARLKRAEMMHGPQRSRQWIEGRWRDVQEALTPREGTTTVEAPQQQASGQPTPTSQEPPPPPWYVAPKADALAPTRPPLPPPPTEYVLTPRGIEPSERGMWQPTPEELKLREEDLKAMEDVAEVGRRERASMPKGKYM